MLCKTFFHVFCYAHVMLWAPTVWVRSVEMKEVDKGGQARRPCSVSSPLEWPYAPSAYATFFAVFMVSRASAGASDLISSSACASPPFR